MKNYPYNTGRTVTINLDTLGNADIWQLFTIATAGTNNVFEGDEPDADPRADSNAAMEIFLHIAETADDRADGADAGQRNFLLGTKEEYLDIFEDGDGPANLPEDQAAPARICQTIDADDEKAERLENIAICRGFDVTLICNTNAGGYTTTVDIIGPEADASALLRAYEREQPEADDTDDAGDVFDRLVAAWRGNPANEDIDALLEANGLDTENEPGNLYRAGVFNGLATAAAWMIYATITPEDDADDINAITAAVYKAYGVAW